MNVYLIFRKENAFIPCEQVLTMQRNSDNTVMSKLNKRLITVCQHGSDGLVTLSRNSARSGQ